MPNEYYSSDEEYVYALADALREEYLQVVEAGLLLQVDDAFIPYNYDRMQLQGASMEEYRKHCELRIEAANYALRGIPEDRVRYHICWGSWAGPHTSDVPLQAIVDLVLRINAQAYSVEAANPRHEYEWKVWRDVKLPEGKILIPGVITHSTNVVEHPETVAERIERYASVVGRENVMAGTDCGFAQGWTMARTHPSVQWAKLRALADGARLASERLWPARAESAPALMAIDTSHTSRESPRRCCTLHPDRRAARRLLAACRAPRCSALRSDGASAAGRQRPDATATAARTPPRGSAAAAAQPKRGGRLRTGQVGDPLNLDPHYFTPLTGDTTFPVLDRLIAYDDKLQPQPQLAESWEQSSDLKQIKLNLRKGVQFHNGREITSDDVKYSMLRVRDPKVASSPASWPTRARG